MTFLSGFEAGAIFAMVAVVVLSVRFRNPLASFFNRFVDHPKASGSRSPRLALGTVQRDVVEALIGQGMRRDLAEWLVRDCGSTNFFMIGNQPAGQAWTFDALFRAVMARRGEKAG